MADEPPKEDLEKILREAKPPWLTEGGGIRGTNPRRIGGPPPPEVAGGRYPIKVEQSLEAPPFPQLEPTQQTTEESEEASATVFPFMVTASPKDFGVKVYPGTIARMGPTIYGAALTNDPPPVFSGIGSDFSLLIKVSIDLTHGVNLRGGVVAPIIITDSLSEPDYFTNGELAMTWASPGHDGGFFFIRIADIQVLGTGVMKLKTQWLFDSYDSFLVNDPDVIILA